MAEQESGSYSVARKMIAYLLVFAGSILLLAWGIMVSQSRHASEGYEDEQGFHFGPDPRSCGCEECLLSRIPIEVESRADVAERV